MMLPASATRSRGRQWSESRRRSRRRDSLVLAVLRGPHREATRSRPGFVAIYCQTGVLSVTLGVSVIRVGGDATSTLPRNRPVGVVNANSVPSGDHVGWKHAFMPLGKFFRFAPFASTIAMAQVVLKSPAEKARRLLSGDQDSEPNRFAGEATTVWMFVAVSYTHLRAHETPEH